MIYTAGIHYNLRVFDAYGNEILDVVECDTESGLVKQARRDFEGRVRLAMDRKTIVTMISYRAAPLRVEEKNTEPKFRLGDRVRDRNGFEWVVFSVSRLPSNEYQLLKTDPLGVRDSWTVRDTKAFDAVAEKVGAAT